MEEIRGDYSLDSKVIPSPRFPKRPPSSSSSSSSASNKVYPFFPSPSVSPLMVLRELSEETAGFEIGEGRRRRRRTTHYAPSFSASSSSHTSPPGIMYPGAANNYLVDSTMEETILDAAALKRKIHVTDAAPPTLQKRIRHM